MKNLSQAHQKLLSKKNDKSLHSVEQAISDLGQQLDKISAL